VSRIPASISNQRPSVATGQQIRKSELSEGRRRLVETMQRVHFGQIRNLHIRAGEPQWNDLVRVARDIKLGSRENARPELTSADFLLRDQVVELFEQLDNLKDATLEVIEVRHGLPFRLFVDDLGDDGAYRD
jgi:hypothetical protein